MVNIPQLIQTNAIPALVGILAGKTEAQYHQLMKGRPNFVAYYQMNNPSQWNMLMQFAPSYRAQINASIIPEREAYEVVRLIKQKGWKVYRHEYQAFVDNIRLLLSYVNGHR